MSNSPEVLLYGHIEQYETPGAFTVAGLSVVQQAVAFQPFQELRTYGKEIPISKINDDFMIIASKMRAAGRFAVTCFFSMRNATQEVVRDIEVGIDHEANIVKIQEKRTVNLPVSDSHTATLTSLWNVDRDELAAISAPQGSSVALTENQALMTGAIRIINIAITNLVTREKNIVVSDGHDVAAAYETPSKIQFGEPITEEREPTELERGLAILASRQILGGIDDSLIELVQPTYSSTSDNFHASIQLLL